MKNILLVALVIINSSLSYSQLSTEEVVLHNMEIELPGTLTLPAGKNPLLIWVHGSGPIDRQGNQPAQNIKASYILQLREALNENGIAFYSYDKRTANKNNANFLKDITVKDFMLDAKEVVQYFKNDARFTQIILAGHSQGSLIAMQALDHVDKYISIAGAAETIDQTIVKQLSAQSPQLSETAKKHFQELEDTGAIAQVDPYLASIFAKPNWGFLQSWMAYNPVDEIKKVAIPILIINGTKDIQVPIENAKRLHAAQPTAKLVLIDNMNHVLKHIELEEDNMKSYYAADYPLSPTLVNQIVSFIENN